MGRFTRSGRPRETFHLRCEHTLGRDPTCDTVLQGSGASRYQTLIRWKDQSWHLRDLGSYNGTRINGRIQAGQALCPLKASDEVQFGDRDEVWILTDDAEPRSLLIPTSDPNQAVIGLESLLPLPSAEQPVATVLGSEEEGFVLEGEGGDRRTLRHGETLKLSGQSHLVHLARSACMLASTAKDGESNQPRGAQGLRLVFDVSPDEESAAATLILGNTSHALPARAHLYLAAHLARVRIADHRSTNRDNSHDAEADPGGGWVDCESLCSDLRITREHLTLQVFRVRKDFLALNPELANQVIDRGWRGRMRIGLTARQLAVKRR